jgi:hypothetical protein
MIHDITYLKAICKKEGTELSTDKHVLDIQKHLRYCISGPRYSFEMCK